LPNTLEELKWISDVCSVPERKCIVVPNGADNNFVGMNLDAVDLSDYPKDFVFSLSVLSGRKNVARLVRAVNELDVPLIHAGKEIEPGYLDVLRRLDEGNKCTFLGEVPNDSPLVGALLKRNRVFALVSEYETPGIAALEAGLQDANCVVTKIGGPSEYFGSNARYVDPFSFSSVKTALSDAWDCGPLSRDVLPNLISTEYSWASVARKTLRAYETIL
jgi:glycosyltransferase involved in cell wall biosynthesis